MRFNIKTFGCQMNDRDSEALLGIFLEKGYSQAKSEKDADLILVNTCSVRGHAENRALSLLGTYKKLKKTKAGTVPVRGQSPLIGLIGCMAKNIGEDVFSKMPHIDLICGPASFLKIPEYVEKIGADGRGTMDEGRIRIKDLEDRERDEGFYGGIYRQEQDHAQVVISTGCSNFCSYCIVPYTRGNLRPRQPENIIAEIEKNIKQGIKKITLLGQNVNDYYSPKPKVQSRL